MVMAKSKRVRVLGGLKFILCPIFREVCLA